MKALAIAVMATLLTVFGPDPSTHAAETGTLAKIRATNTMTIGYRTDSPPFSSSESSGGVPQGFSIDLCQRVADQVKTTLGLTAIEIKYLPLTPENRFKAVADGRVDIECGNSTITLSRREEVDFSLKTFITGASMLTLSSAEVPNVAALNGKTITVVAGTTTEKALEDKLKELKIDAKVIKLSDHGKALEMLESGKSDAHVADQLVLIGLARNAPDPKKFSVVMEPFTYEPYGLAVRRNDDDFRLVVDRTLAGLYRSGEIGQIFDKWFGDWGGRPSRLLIAMWALNGLPE